MIETTPSDCTIKCLKCGFDGFVGFITNRSVGYEHEGVEFVGFITDYEHEVVDGMDIETFQVTVCPKCGEKLDL